MRMVGTAVGLYEFLACETSLPVKRQCNRRLFCISDRPTTIRYRDWALSMQVGNLYEDHAMMRSQAYRSSLGIESTTQFEAEPLSPYPSLD